MDYAVTTEELSKKFGDFIAVDKLNLHIEAGSVCGFLGPNGAGKSTAMRMLCGILEPSSGNGKVLGFDLRTASERIKDHLGYMSQKFSLYDELSVLENLDFFAGLYSIPRRERKARIEEMLNMAELGGLEAERVFTLSPGLKQRLALGCAIISQPSILFLDEPTSGVSPGSRRAFFNIIQELAAKGATVIVSTHFMDEAERCDKIAFFNQGKLLALDSPDQLKHNVLEGLLAELDIPNPMEKMADIQSLEFVKECSLHGLLLHVLLEKEAGLGRLEEFTGTAPQLITPTLEDVFMALARKREQVNA
ncbi:MAG: ABC transporter ATP-binding protein [Syntrophomonadaceae bacterium]|nr:ABC transporter ATP-binding protein [Syntrophomonadaceae bacterium]MDD3023151.1 ABC transporter ATP-binding protein [Syntrophomonadaceae bacterium]